MNLIIEFIDNYARARNVQVYRTKSDTYRNVKS